MIPDGNTILVTGGGSGIGLGLARAFLALGNSVIIAGRRQDALDAAIAQTPGLIGYTLDVTDPVAITDFAARVIAAHPDLNVVINNAGIMRGEDLQDDAHVADAEAMVTTNLLGPIRLSAALMAQLKGRPRATIVNVTSGLAFVPLTRTATYSATKAALHSYTMSLRHELRDTAIEVLEIAPPLVQTELTPGQSQNPNGLSLDAFIAETMALFASDPTPPELCVKAVGVLRDADAEGRFASTFAMLNPADAAAH